MDPHNFFDELKRRNVYRVATAYAVISWLIIQVATQILPIFEIPHWVVRAVILLLALGFPVALILAWAFELTPEGVKRTDEVLSEEPRPPTTGQRWRLGAIAVTLLNVALQISDYKNPTLAIILVVVAICLFLPSLRGKGATAWSAGKRSWQEYVERNPLQLLLNAILIGMIFGAILLGVIWWAIKSDPPINQSTADTTPSPSLGPMPARHINRHTPKQIYDILSKEHSFHKDEVAREFENGQVDWMLTFSSAQKLRDDPSRIIVSFNPEGTIPPLVRCEAPLRGNEYLGRMESGAFVFHVKGVIKEVDWENNRINLTEASFYQVPRATPSP